MIIRLIKTNDKTWILLNENLHLIRILKFGKKIDHKMQNEKYKRDKGNLEITIAQFQICRKLIGGTKYMKTIF